MTLKRLRTMTRDSIPDLDGVVGRSGHYLCGVMGEGDRVNAFIMAIERLRASIPMVFYGWLQTQPTRLMVRVQTAYGTFGRAENQCRGIYLEWAYLDARFTVPDKPSCISNELGQLRCAGLLI
jgi:hypothetical protein